MEDGDVPGWWSRLGLPGLIDIHTHFMPRPVMDAVWRYFDDARTPLRAGLAGAVPHRRGDRIATLRALGVRRFTSLLYPHKPDMAASLNEWARDFAARVPDCAQSGTFYPEPAAAGYLRTALEGGTAVFKAHVQVGGYDPRDPLLDPVWGQLAEAGTPVVVHCGSGPLAGPHTGPGPFGAVLRAHPRLTAVIAHCGAPEYAEHLALAERYPNVHLDTTMVGTAYMERLAAFPRDLLPRLAQLQDRVVLGSDFPNIPYPLAEQLAALERFGLGERWLRAVCWDNGARLLGSPVGQPEDAARRA